MALPLPKVLYDVEPGGRITTVMNATNALANNMHLREINRIKAKYAPWLTQADINSKNAYAQLVGLQPLGKIMANELAYANVPDAKKAEMNNRFLKAGGVGQVPYPQAGSGNNATNNMPNNGSLNLGAPPPAEKGNPLANIGQFIADTFKGMFPQANAQQSMPTNSLVNPQPNVMQQAAPMPSNQNQSLPSVRPKGGVSVVGEQWYDKNNNPITTEEIEDNGTPVELEVTTGNMPKKQKSFAETLGAQRGTINQGAKSGEYRAEALKDVGNTLLSLSNSGAAQDELIKIQNNPKWQHARDTIPAFQKEQLSVLKVTGDPELRTLIGEWTAAGQAMIASQVAGMGSRHLVREYNLAEKQKINDSDTIESGEGKLRNAKNLHDIAEKKNIIIKNLLKQGIDEADAVEIANKKVDVSAIRRATDKLLERKISVTSDKTGKTKMMSIKEAQELGVPNV